ncbi:hypothetical protein MGG_04364 [Pyricularia oryzae 70-15]|uniref:DUF3074 domain-containing protein n=3 Tax=Pyricularia oryzae TaxID=318829 RepID=G4MZB3_PYRO7|nr:uncharacterized protein MGG_04364 [Pyricularia oryzae 70-15]EHA53668.1 hypothetical protein MGG_04364 [Pyricularia oryzae 70-15]
MQKHPLSSRSNTADMSNDQLGPKVRLWGIADRIAFEQHPDQHVPPLVSHIVTEAARFINTAAPKDSTTPMLFKHKSRKTPAGSTAPVSVSTRSIPKAVLDRIHRENPSVDRRGVKSETWVCRRSVHEDLSIRGTASWAEFRDCLKDRHAETEKAFTPTMVAHQTVQEHLVVRDMEPVSVDGLRYGDFTCATEGVRHKVAPCILQDRVFFVLQITCSVLDEENATTAAHEFLVVNIPMADHPDSLDPQALYRGATLGAYASVERIRILPAGHEDAGKIEWIMATASDAKGILPRFAQDLAVPDQIVKDVPLFFDWIDSQRAPGAPEEPMSEELSEPPR